MKITDRVKKLEKQVKDNTPMTYLADDYIDIENDHTVAIADAKAKGYRVNILRIGDTWE